MDVAKDSKDILEAVFLDPNYYPLAEITTVDLCSAKGIKCSIKAGTEFTTTLEKVKVPDADTLCKGSLEADILDENYEDYEFLACALSDPISWLSLSFFTSLFFFWFT